MFKKMIAIVFVAAILATVVAGEAPADEARWDLFITGGWSRGMINDRDKLVANDQEVNGYTAGVAAQLRIYDEFAIEAGVRYTQKGGKGTIDSTFSVPNFANVTQPIGSATVELDYIELPLLFAFIWETSYDSYLRGYFGPSINWLVRSHVTGVSGGQPIDQDMDDVLSNAEWTVVVGASFNYNFDSWQALIDGRWVMGLSSIDDVSEDIAMRTETWEFSLGVGIPLAGY